MEKTLSFDLGSNSNGWFIRDTAYGKDQLRKFGVITFDTGVGKDDKGKFTISFAAQRTAKRSIRRLYQSRKYKLWATLKLLEEYKFCPIQEGSLYRWQHYSKEEALKGNGGRAYPIEDKLFANWIKLDFNNDRKPDDYTSPYQLRLELITEKLDFTIAENKYKLGRALYHIAQHRGFKSSKKVQNKDENFNSDEDFIGAEKKRSKAIGDLMEKHGVTTVGAAFAFEEKAGNRIRQELHKDVLRKQLQEEVKQIFHFQGLSVEDAFFKGILKAIFWQRPLRSQKGSVGKCTLEPNKYRCPVSHPAFEEFRAWSLLNNIKYKNKGDKEAIWKQIPPDYRKGIYEEKFFRVSKANFDFFEIAQWIKKKNEHDNWDLNYNFKTNVSACPVSARLKDIFGDKWDLIETRFNKNGEKYQVPFYEDIWHTLFNYNDDDKAADFAKNILKLDEGQIKKFIGLWFSMPVDYSSLSLKAISNILPFLRLGLIYTEATLLAKVPEILGTEVWEEKSNCLIDNISNIIQQNRKDKKRIGIANNLIANYKAASHEERYADRNFDYIIGDFERKQASKACYEDYGKITWEEKGIEEKTTIETEVLDLYQSFFIDKDRRFKKMPHLLDTMKIFLRKISDLTEKQIGKLYHPSQIDIYPPAKEGYYEDVQKHLTLLGSPKAAAFKNPMAMRALHELRKFTNYLIKTEQVDENTRIVIELARELNDNNKRWAIDTYQKRKEEENKEFAEAIRELIKDPEAIGSLANPDSDEDIDKFRLWYEMIEGEDASEGYEKDKNFVINDKETKIKKNKKGSEDEYEVFAENVFDKINKSLYFKLKRAKDNVIAKYAQWKKQDCRCMYTGRMIGITDLFKEVLIDFEHTIPRSISFDNSLENRTVCYASYNRNIKKNQIPYNLPNYEHDALGYTAIKPRLEKWEQKVKDLEMHIEFWKAKSGRATDKSDKDYAIRQKHLWQFELDYWREKLARFTIPEVKSGFKNSQLVDTQIISKYASHYLKTVFNKVEVQKGTTTSEFRKIFGIQNLDERKDRSNHSHHAKDALILSLIPVAALRDQILKLWYEIDEQNKMLKYVEQNKRIEIASHIAHLQEQLDKLVKDCKLPNVNAAINKIDEEIIINNIAKDQTLTIAKKRIRSRGKVVGQKDKNKQPIYQTDKNGNLIQRKDGQGKLVFKNDQFGNTLVDDVGNLIPVYIPKEKWAKGDIIRGQLHKESFFGAIRLIEKDENGRFIKNEDGNYKLEDVKYVIREELVFKKDDQSPGFKTLKEIEDVIVDKHLFQIIKKQVDEVDDFKDVFKNGVWMLDKHGNQVHKIRHIRCVVIPKGEVQIKRHTHLSKHVHKQYVISENAETPYYGLYQNKDGGYMPHDCRTLWQAAGIKSDVGGNGLKDFFINKVDQELTVLSKQQRLFLLKDKTEPYKELSLKEQNSRIYKITKFYKKEGYIQMQYHLDARDNKTLKKDFPEDALDDKGKRFGKRGINGFSEQNYDNPLHRLLLSRKNFNFLIEGKHFELEPDGKIKWNA